MPSKELPDGWVRRKRFFKSSSYEYYRTRKVKGKIEITATLMQPIVPKRRNTKGDWSRKIIETSFEDLAKILSMNMRFLPEPLHYGYHQDLPYIIFRAHEGRTPTIKPSGDKLNKQGWFIIIDIAKKIPYLLHELEKKGVFLQEIPVDSLLWSFGNYYLNHFHTLIKKESATKYNPSFSALEPMKMYSAPESFMTDTALTSKTHVYLYGKLLLELIMGSSRFQSFFRDNPFPSKQEYEELLRDLNIPSSYEGFRTLVQTSLSHDPYYRYTNVLEGRKYLKDFLGEKSTSSHQGLLVMKMDSLTKTHMFIFSHLYSALKKRGIFRSKKILFYDYLPYKFKETLKKQGFELYELPEDGADFMEETIKKRLNQNIELIYVTDESLDLKPFLQSSLSSIKRLLYVSKRNPFPSDQKIHFLDVKQFIKEKRPRLRS